MNRESKNQFLIYLTLCLSLLLDVYVFPVSFMAIKPSLVLLVLIYWNMALPDRVGIAAALLFGTLIDLLEGSLLGLHGTLFLLITYMCQRFFYQFRVSGLWQQSIIIFFLCILYKQILALDLLNVNESQTNLSDVLYFTHSLLFALFSALLWSPVLLILRYYRRRWVKS